MERDNVVVDMEDGILAKYVELGSKVDIRVRRRNHEEGIYEMRVYPSQVFDILSEERIEITMPMDKTKILLLPIGGEHDLLFYTGNTIYQCKAKIVDREKRNNTYLLIMDLISNLRRDQRREYYRFSCALEMDSRILEKEEIKALEKSEVSEDNIVPRLPLKRSVIVDISGGGLRFIADYKYDEDSIVLCKYQLDSDEGSKTYEVLGKVLSVTSIESRQGMYEHRVKYIKIDKEVREEIIRFIFEEERKNLKKERLE